MADTKMEAFGTAGPAPTWYHGDQSRGTAESRLTGAPSGTFFIRDSTSSAGDFVMSVSESSRVSHYIIRRKGHKQYHMGDRDFTDLVDVINFYKTHLLDSTTLSIPLPLDGKLAGVNLSKSIFSVKALYTFNAKDTEDLSFTRGDTLNIIEQSEPQWWKAQSQRTMQIGSVPINYIERPDAPSGARGRPLERTDSVMGSTSSRGGRPLPPPPEDGIEDTYEAMGGQPPALPSRGPAPPPPVLTQELAYGDNEAPVDAPPPLPPAPGGRGRGAAPPLPPPEDEPAPPPPRRPLPAAPAPAVPAPARPPAPAPTPVAPTPLISRPPPVTFLPEHLTVAMPLNPKGEPPAERPKFIMAKALFDRVANAYDRTALSFRAGDCIHVLIQNENGLWKGTIFGGDGKEGWFPFTLVELLDSAAYDDDIAALETKFNLQMDAIYGTN